MRNSFYRADDVVLQAKLDNVTPETLAEIESIEVSYTQEEATWWRTTKVLPEDIDTDGTWYVVLTKEDTNCLCPDRALVFQCLIKFKNGVQKHTNYASQAVKDILVEGH